MRHGCLGKRKRKRREYFGLRWQPAEAKRSEDWSGAATPLFDCGQSFQSGVALCFPPQSKKNWLRQRRPAPFAGLVFSRGTAGTGAVGGIRHSFCQRKRSIGACFSARSLCPEHRTGDDLPIYEKNPLIFGQALDRKKLEFIV